MQAVAMATSLRVVDPLRAQSHHWCRKTSLDTLRSTAVPSTSSSKAGGKRIVSISSQARDSRNDKEEQISLGRRQIVTDFAITAATAALLSPASALASEDGASSAGPSVYEDVPDNFSLQIPADWDKGEGKAGTRKVIAFYPPNNAADTNVNMVITMLGADFTSLGSFGTAEIFGENLVNGLDRSWQRPPGQAAKLISTKSRNGMYYVEYTLQKVGEPKRHFLSAVGIHDNGIYNRLYTLTGQYLDNQSDVDNKLVSEAVASFKFLR